MEYQFSNHIWVELLLSINSSEVYWQSSYCSRIIKNTFIICQTRKREAERQAGSERPLPPEQMMGEQPGITGCLATERFPRDSKQWERGSHKMDHKMDEKRAPSGDHLVSSEPHSSDYSNARIWSGPKTEMAKTHPKKKKQWQTPRQEGSREDKVIPVLNKTLPLKSKPVLWCFISVHRWIKK